MAVLQLNAQTPLDSLYLSQIERTMDSLERMQRVVEEVQKYEDRLLKDEMRFHYKEAMPLVRGLIQLGTNRPFIRHDGLFAEKDFEVQDYAVAGLPLATAWTLKLLGVESRSKSKRMVTANVLAAALTLGMTGGLKNSVDELRPNGINNHSFPSGHVALAFMGATILEREFGHISPWVTVGGYAVATTTEWLRLRHNAHYVHDIFTGAGIGIVATNLAYFITDRIFGPKAVNRPRLYQGDVVRLGRFLEQPVSVSLVAGSEITPKHIDDGAIDLLQTGGSSMPLSSFGGTVRLRTSSTFSSGVDYSYFFDSRWALDAGARISTTQAKVDLRHPTLHDADFSGNVLNQYHLNLGFRYSVPLGFNVRVAARAFGGGCCTKQTDFHYLSPVPQPLSLIRVPQSWDAEAGAGISVEMLETKNCVTGFSIDYLHSFSKIFPDRCLVNSYWKILL